MKDYGMIRVAAAVPRVKVADVAYNLEGICRLIDEAEAQDASIVVFPELSVTGYTCGDLFAQELLLQQAEDAVGRIAVRTRGKHVTVVAGAPVRLRGRLYNCAVVIRNGGIKGMVPKIYLPTYAEFDESRWFASGADFLSPSAHTSGRMTERTFAWKDSKRRSAMRASAATFPRTCSSPSAGRPSASRSARISGRPFRRRPSWRPPARRSS